MIWTARNSKANNARNDSYSIIDGNLVLSDEMKAIIILSNISPYVLSSWLTSYTNMSEDLRYITTKNIKKNEMNIFPVYNIISELVHIKDFIKFFPESKYESHHKPCEHCSTGALYFVCAPYPDRYKIFTRCENCKEKHFIKSTNLHDELS